MSSRFIISPTFDLHLAYLNPEHSSENPVGLISPSFYACPQCEPRTGVLKSGCGILDVYSRAAPATRLGDSELIFFRVNFHDNVGFDCMWQDRRDVQGL